LVTLFIGMILPLIIVNNLAGTYYKKLAHTLNSQIDNQVQHYEMMADVTADLANMQHDYKNLKIGILSMANSGNSEELQRYLQNLDSAIFPPALLYNTGNPISDALLTDKQNGAADHNIQIEFDGRMPVKMIETRDICLILGNALDNAVESCVQLPREDIKIISIRANMHDGYLFLKLSNPTLQQAQIKNNRIATTKADAGKHGMGLLSIQRAAKRYAGNMVLHCANNVFTIELDLDLSGIAVGGCETL